MNAPTHPCQNRMMAYRLPQFATLLGVLVLGGGGSLLAQSAPTFTAGHAMAAAPTEQLAIEAGSTASLLREPRLGIAAPPSAPVIPKSASPAAGSWDSTPRWLRWGLVGAAAGAVAFPLLGGLGGGGDGSAAGDALAGAAVGFVIIGGAVALWDALCAGDTSSRRAGLCGR